MNPSYLASQLHSCAKHRLLSPGKSLHAQLIKTGLQNCEPLPNSLVDFYGKCGLNYCAQQVFDEAPQRDLISWASVLTAHNQANLPQIALSIFPNMLSLDGLKPDHFVLATLVRACSSLSATRLGKQVHAQFAVSAYSNDDVIKSSLVDFYAKCGLVKSALSVFDLIEVKNSISWTAMITAYARSGMRVQAVELLRKMPESRNLLSWTALISGLVLSGNSIDAFNLFVEMQREGMPVGDAFVLSSLVGASASMAALDLGMQIHCIVKVLGFESDLFVSNALVDMYSKCSDVLAAMVLFSAMFDRDVVSWTTIIVGMAQHGQATKALSFYNSMVSTGLNPNEVTFLGLIYACSHVGLVAKGRMLFNSMLNDFGIRPSLMHYTCFLDLLGRSGHLNEAESVINTMPFVPDEATWASFLSACRSHGNGPMSIRVADHLLKLNLEDSSTYILLSNVYAAAGLWENVSKVRRLMLEMEFVKRPGYSAVDVGREREFFYAGETSHPMKIEISGLLKELDDEMKKRGYIPDTSWVLHDLEEKEKERLLFGHSERWAVAYGLLKGVRGGVIRVMKNLRVCGDCHTVMKFISSIAKREIVVRDATRFHHFKGGKCSCNDFW